jgi:hypothetical protein
VLTGLSLCAGFATPVMAQILGNQTPGTPGAIDGELRTTRSVAPPIPRGPALRGAEDADETAIPPKFGIRRNANTAARRRIEPGQGRTSGYPGASPAGGLGTVPPGSTLRRPRDLTGARFGNAADANAGAPPLGRPSLGNAPGPGLPPVAPVVPRRAPREDDPYAALGIRAGTMILRPAIEVSGGYDSNAARSGTNRKGSPLYRTEAELAATSDWSRHQLDIGLRGAFTGYTAVTNANRPEGDARIALRLDATRDLVIDTALTARIDTENPNSANLPGGVSKRTPFYTSGAALGATQRFGRLALTLRGTLDRTDYADAEAGGVTVSQRARNLSTYGLRLRAGYEITPGITPFAEVLADRRVHDLRADDLGFRRDSTGTTLRIGSSFELARNLTGEASAGYIMRAYEDARLKHLRAPALDAALTWSISPLTSLNLRAQSEITETTLANSSGARVYRGTATLTHAFLRNFTATAVLGFSKADYEGVNRQETGINSALRLEYKFNRMLALRTSYGFEHLNVNLPGESYNAHTFLLGMRYTP